MNLNPKTIKQIEKLAREFIRIVVIIAGEEGIDAFKRVLKRWIETKTQKPKHRNQRPPRDQRDVRSLRLKWRIWLAAAGTG